LIPSGPGAAQFSVAISGPAQTGVVVARGGVCSLVASFTPTTTDAFTAAVGFMDNSGAGSPQVVILNDAGTGMAPLPTIAPTSVSFGTQPVGITSGTQTVTLTNTGSASLQLTGIATTGSNSTNFGFLVKVAPPCPSPSGTLAAGASCTISVDFAPHAAEPVSATLSISDNATGSPQSVALSGTSGTSGITLTPASLNFASQTAGASSAPQVVNVNNTGTTPVAMTISIVGNNPGDFAETDNCSESPLAGGKTGVIIATFDPTQTGGRSADVLISDTASQNPQMVAVSGTAVQAAATISPAGTISFGSARAGTESAPVTVTITNSGTPPAMLTVRGATVNPYRNFTPTKNCTADVPASGNCTLTVTFSPPASPVAAPCGSDAGAKTATLTITDNSPTSPQNIALSGTATDFCLAPAGVTSQTFTAGNPVTHQHVADSLGTFRRRGRAHLHGRSIAQHLHSAAATVNLSSGAQAPIALSVVTATNSVVPFGKAPDARRFGPSVPPATAWAWRGIVLWMVLLLLLILAWASTAKRQSSRAMRFAQTGALAILLSIGLVACFGSGTSTATLPPVGTITGTYTITVTGTFTGTEGSKARNAQVTLVVQ
jgi:hypothetical protein